MTGEPTHTASKQWHCTLPSYINYRLKREVFIVGYLADPSLLSGVALIDGDGAEVMEMGVLLE